ncbi:hypothetical protein [Parasediminibacterium sp. JCM 36343]|uniref:hypothetical protein n=1 Tax=Parasediminibacterium sp. JCM 36343 TaxID=3374279 RepID=UPI0039793AC6
MNIITKKIAIGDLILWDENARFPDKYYNSDEEELINFFISNTKFEMKKFIEEIAYEYDMPQLEKLIVWDNGDNLIVIEGNRRLTAYKVLIKPELIKDSKLQNFVRELKEKISIDNNFSLECLISNNEQDCLKYVDRKHIKRNNEVGWQEPERVAFSIRRGDGSQNNLIIQGITKIVRNLDLPSEMINKVLGKGYVTTFFRAITTTPSKKKYKYEIVDGEFKVNYKDFNNELKVIIYSILKKEDFDGKTLDSRSLNTTENIEVFIQSVKSEDVKQVNEAIKKNTIENIFGETTVNIGHNNNSKSKELSTKNITARSKSIPLGLFYSNDIPFKINNSSLRILYEELREINVSEFPNATHDLLRSFLECSLIFFFKHINEYGNIKKSDPHNPKLGEMLTHIINEKCSHVNDKNLIEVLKLVKADYDQPYSLERMNMINHNENCASTEKDVRKAWAQLEGLFKIILNPTS